jgi:hypothetical protein
MQYRGMPWLHTAASTICFPETCDDIAGIRFRRFSDCIVVNSVTPYGNGLAWDKNTRSYQLIGSPGWSDLMMAPQKHDR